MSFREIPQPISRVLAAARRIDPVHGLFVTYAPGTHGEDWELHAFKRSLIIRSLRDEVIVEAVACSLLARTAYLGKEAVTGVPRHLRSRYQQARDALVAELTVHAEAS